MSFPSSPPTPSWPTQNTIPSSINSIAALCEATGADVQEVVALNTWQQHRISALVVRRLFGTVSGKRIAVTRLRPSASAATYWKKAPSWRSLIPR